MQRRDINNNVIFESMFMLQLSHASLPIFSFIYVVSDNLQSAQCSKTIENKGDGIIGLVSPHWSIFRLLISDWLLSAGGYKVNVKMV